MRFLSALLLSVLAAPQAAADFVRYTGPKVCARGTGDPHMTTYDGVKYDCQGEGDFIMSKSLDGDFELQGRFEQVPGRSVTTTQNVVLKTGYADEPTVEIAYTKQCDLTYSLDGAEVDLENSPAPKSDNFQFYAEGNYRSFMFPSGVELKVSLRSYRGDCLLSTYLCIPEALAQENIVGILGSPDTNEDNDFMMRDGTPFEPKPLTRRSMNEYCKAVWCVPTVEENLFNEPGVACGVEMKSADEIIFGPTLEEVKCGDMQEDTKCPLGHADRLYRLPPQGAAPKETLASCRQACLENAECGFYSFGMPDSSHPGVCMGCSNSGKREHHKGFNFYAKDCVGDQKAGELDELVDNADPEIITACEHNAACIIDAELVDGTLEEKLEAGLRTLEEEKIDPSPPSQEAILANPAPPKVRTAGDDGQDKTKVKESGSGAKGDPHFKTFGGEMYDFHGECDLVLVHNPDFKNGLGMDIHIRTKIEDFWSSIETSAMMIGEDVMEVKADENSNEWLWVNGVAVTLDMEEGKWYRASIAGFLIRYREHKIRAGTVREAHVYLGSRKEKMAFKAFKSFVRVDVDINSGGPENFIGAVGMLGAQAHNGKRLGRDGSMIEDVNAFGQEWQVQPEVDGKLFHSDVGAVVEGKCIMPPEWNEESAAKQTARKRRLGAAAVDTEMAEAACDNLVGQDKKDCVFDVLATQDLDMASVW